MKFKTKQEIEAWLNKSKIIDYLINGDLTIDVNCSVDLSYLELKEIPVTFNIVDGNFSCLNNQLTSLDGCPIKIIGSFNCGDNQLTSLKYCPQKINGDFDCYFNKLTSLEFCPEYVNSFNCSHNELINLKFCPKKIDGHFNCSYNKLNTLYYIPEEVNEIIFLNDNPLLWKYQPIKTYEELVMANDLYTLKDRLKVNLGVNTKTIKI